MGVDGYDRDGVADRLREYCELAAGARDRQAEGNSCAASHGSDARAHRCTTVDRDIVAFGARRGSGTGAGVLGGQGLDGDLSAVGGQWFEYFHGPGFSDFVIYACGDRSYRSDFWVGSGAPVDAARCGTDAEGSSWRGGRRWQARAGARRAGGYAGGHVTAAANWRGTVLAEPEESQQPGSGVSRGTVGGLQHRSIAERLFSTAIEGVLSAIDG